MNKVIRGEALYVMREVLRRQKARTASAFKVEEVEAEEDGTPDLLEQMEGRRRGRRKSED